MVFTEGAESACQGCAQLSAQFVLARHGVPSETAEGGSENLADGGGNRRELIVGREHFDIAERPDESPPNVDVFLIAEQRHHLEKLGERGHPGDRCSPCIAGETVTFDYLQLLVIV